MKNRKIVFSVIGGHEINEEVGQLSYKIGHLISKVGGVLVCGGLGGVMEKVSKGVKDSGGTTIGLLPGDKKSDANPYIDIVLPTSLGYARNAVVACSADIIVALPGSYGTNTEICYGLVYKRPVIDLGSWNIKGMIPVKNLDEAEIKIKELIEVINHSGEENEKTSSD